MKNIINNYYNNNNDAFVASKKTSSIFFNVNFDYFVKIDVWKSQVIINAIVKKKSNNNNITLYIFAVDVELVVINAE